jgi:hypothetical protein
LADSDCGVATPLCMTSGRCHTYDDEMHEYCESNVCGLGDPDCDGDDTEGCSEGLVCGSDNCADFHDLAVTGLAATTDCCTGSS